MPLLQPLEQSPITQLNQMRSICRLIRSQATAQACITSAARTTVTAVQRICSNTQGNNYFDTSMSQEAKEVDLDAAPIDGTAEGRARAAAAREAAKRKHAEVVKEEEPRPLGKKAKKAVPRTSTSTHTVAVPEGYEPETVRDAAVFGGLARQQYVPHLQQAAYEMHAGGMNELSDIQIGALCCLVWTSSSSRPSQASVTPLSGSSQLPSVALLPFLLQAHFRSPFTLGNQPNRTPLSWTPSRKPQSHAWCVQQVAASCYACTWYACVMHMYLQHRQYDTPFMQPCCQIACSLPAAALC